MMRRSPSPARSCGASVRVASIHATHPPSVSTRATSCRTSDVLPAPIGPTTSVTRPRGTPPPSAASSSRTPVGHAGPAPRPPATTSATSARNESRLCGVPSSCPMRSPLRSASSRRSFSVATRAALADSCSSLHCASSAPVSAGSNDGYWRASAACMRARKRSRLSIPNKYRKFRVS
jgi:hypothetical protein